MASDSRRGTREDPIASVDGVIGTRVVGVDAAGLPIRIPLPALPAEIWLDPAGSEVAVPIQCHRARTAQSERLYGAPERERLRAEGWLAKVACPIATEQAPGAAHEACDAKTLRAALVASLVPGGAPYHGCPHYLALRDERRKRSEAVVRQYKSVTPEQATVALQDQLSRTLSAMERIPEAMASRREQMRAARSDRDS